VLLAAPLAGAIVSGAGALPMAAVVLGGAWAAYGVPPALVLQGFAASVPLPPVALHLLVMVGFGIFYGVLAATLRVDKARWAALLLAIAMAGVASLARLDLAAQVPPALGWASRLAWCACFLAYPSAFWRLRLPPRTPARV
jgi:hypothetical protein